MSKAFNWVFADLPAHVNVAFCEHSLFEDVDLESLVFLPIDTSG